MENECSVLVTVLGLQNFHWDAHTLHQAFEASETPSTRCRIGVGCLRAMYFTVGDSIKLNPLLIQESTAVVVSN